MKKLGVAASVEKGVYRTESTALPAELDPWRGVKRGLPFVAVLAVMLLATSFGAFEGLKEEGSVESFISGTFVIAILGTFITVGLALRQFAKRHAGVKWAAGALTLLCWMAAVLIESPGLAVTFGATGFFLIISFVTMLGDDRAPKSVWPPEQPALKLRLHVKRLASSPGAEDLGPYWFLELRDGTRYAHWDQSLLDVQGGGTQGGEDGAPICREWVEFTYLLDEHRTCVQVRTWGAALKEVEVMDEPKATWAFEKKLMDTYKVQECNRSFWKMKSAPTSLFEEALRTDKKLVFATAFRDRA